MALAVPPTLPAAVKPVSEIVPGSNGVMLVIDALVTVPSESVALTLALVTVPRVVDTLGGQVGIIGALAQAFVGEALFRGFGVPALKSVALLSVSVHPFAARSTAVVLLGAGVEPVPSKQVVLPKPTKSMMLAPVGQAPLSAVVLLTSATLPAAALILIVPVASGVGRFVVPPVPKASWTKK